MKRPHSFLVYCGAEFEVHGCRLLGTHVRLQHLLRAACLSGSEYLPGKIQLFFGREGSVEFFGLLLGHKIVVGVFVGAGNAVQKPRFQFGNEE